jgi:hypothetical protein
MLKNFQQLAVTMEQFSLRQLNRLFVSERGVPL